MCLNPPYSQLHYRKPPLASWQDGSWSSAASSHQGGSCQCPAQPSPAWKGTLARPRQRRGLPGGSSQRWGCSAHVPEMTASPRISKCLGDESTALRPLPEPCCHRAPAAPLGLSLEGRQAVLTSRAVLLHAAPPGLQPCGTRGPVLPGSLRHLPHPRLHAPFAAAGSALVGTDAPLAPRPRLARLCKDSDRDRDRTGWCPLGAGHVPRDARGAGAAHLGTRGCRAVPRCRGGTAGNIGPCTRKTCPCTSCRSLC